MSERIKSIVEKISQETIMILAIGLTVLVSLFAAWNSLAGQIEAVRTAMHEGDARLLAAMNEGDARLRQERREDVAGLRGELTELRIELRGEMGELGTELRTEVRAMGQRIDRLTEAVMLLVARGKGDPQPPGNGSRAPGQRESERENP